MDFDHSLQWYVDWRTRVGQSTNVDLGHVYIWSYETQVYLIHHVNGFNLTYTK